MDRDAAVTLLKARLKRSQTTIYDAAIATEMQLAQKRLELGAFLPWFLEETNSTFVLNPGSPQMGVPGGFLRFPEEEAIYYRAYLSTDPWKLVPIEEEQYLSDRYGAELGEPKGASLRGDVITFYPGPDKSYGLKFLFYKGEAGLTQGGSTNDWLTIAPDLLIVETAVKIALSYLRDSEL